MKSKLTSELLIASQRMVVLVLAGTLAGCSTIRLPEYRAASPGASARTLDLKGLVIAVDPFLEKARSQQYFGFDARQADIVILHVRITNKSADSTFLLHKDNFKLLPTAVETGGTATSSNIERRPRGGDAMALTGAALISMPLLFIGIKMSTDANVVQNNLTAKELGNQTLAPGQTMEGFVYYRLPEKQRLGAGAKFVVVAGKIATQETVRLEVPMPNEN